MPTFRPHIISELGGVNLQLGISGDFSEHFHGDGLSPLSKVLVVKVIISFAL